MSDQGVADESESQHMGDYVSDGNRPIVSPAAGYQTFRGIQAPMAAAAG